MTCATNHARDVEKAVWDGSAGRVSDDKAKGRGFEYHRCHEILGPNTALVNYSQEIAMLISPEGHLLNENNFLVL